MRFYFTVGGSFGKAWIAFGASNPSGRSDVIDHVEFLVDESPGITQLGQLISKEPNCGTLIAAYIISRSLDGSTADGQDPLGIIRGCSEKVSRETWDEIARLLRTDNDCASFVEQVAPEIASLFRKYISIFAGVIDFKQSGRND